MPSLKRAVLIAAMALSFAVSATILPIVDQARGALGRMSYRGDVPKPPELVLLTNVLGGFRGLIVDLVWLRAGKLQQTQKYWELYQLYDWIGKLEPHLEDIWVHNGWNMAYNLVAEHPVSEARWQWIDRAIRWMRDEGLKYNPRSGKIMKEIAWTYCHKIGRNTDLHHFYYKHRFALIMHAVFGSREMQDIPGIVAAPKELSKLLADKDVAWALSDFQLSPPEPDVEALAKANGLHEIPERLRPVLQDPKNAEAWRKVRCFIARRVLVEVYKFDDPRDEQDTLTIMADMENRFGKFDWRLPEPHAIFWALRATLVMRPLDDPKEFYQTQIHYDRVTLFSLQETMRRGTIAYMSTDPNETLVTTFDLSKVQRLYDLYDRLLVEYDIAAEVYGSASMRDGHVTFLQEAAFVLFFAGYEKEAQKYYKRLNDDYDKPSPRVPLKEYCLGLVKDRVEVSGTESQVSDMVNGMINKALFYFCVNKPDEARMWESQAREAWRIYSAYTEKHETGRTRVSTVPAWKDMLRARILAILKGEDRSFPADLVPILAAKLGLKSPKQLDAADFGEGIVPKIEPSSPPPE